MGLIRTVVDWNKEDYMANESTPPLIIANTENEVLARIEMVNDVVTRNALRSLFFWRLGTQSAVKLTNAKGSSS